MLLLLVLQHNNNVHGFAPVQQATRTVDNTIRQPWRKPAILLHDWNAISKCQIGSLQMASVSTQAKDIASDKKNANKKTPYFPPGKNGKDPSITSAAAGITLSCPKVRVLKDRMWARETLEDLTAAEFACKLSEASSEDKSSSTATGGLFQRKKRAVDFENLLQKLEKRIDEMCLLISNQQEAEQEDFDECYYLDASQKQQGCFALVDGKGMGSQVYTHEQRRALLLKLLTDRQELLAAMDQTTAVWEKAKDDNAIIVVKNQTTVIAGTLPAFDEAADLEEIRSQLQGKRAGNVTEGKIPVILSKNITNGMEKINDKKPLNATSNANVTSITLSTEEPALQSTQDSISSSTEGSTDVASPNLYVREDGTVDWEGALQDRSALKLFGTSVWARINGQDPASVDEDNFEQSTDSSHGKKSAVTAKVIETDAIRLEKNILFRLKQEYSAMEARHLSLLQSGLSAGAAVANVNLASLDPTLRSRIRESTALLEKKREEVAFRTLVYELERIFVYLDGEMGNTRAGYIPLQDRLNVAEFGLLESQIESLSRQLDNGEYIDSDVLTILVDQLNDFKRRLGIDYYVTGVTFDGEAIRRWLADLWEQIKTGVSFYVKGCKLLWNDVVFCGNLIGKAMFQGYTLKPREVRTLRRTLKDILTFIPFVIILIIPLSPIGHVLVFGAIQRFFPDFFPSCFTERRQNLLQLYESTEYTDVVINETLQEKLIRIGEAFTYFLVEGSRSMYRKLNGYYYEDSNVSTSTTTTTPTSATNSTTNGAIEGSKK